MHYRQYVDGNEVDSAKKPATELVFQAVMQITNSDLSHLGNHGVGDALQGAHHGTVKVKLQCQMVR
ncbi:hypothetical protein QN372_20580 [Undibacterium sp. RTI2.1]|uniref:hypothetical protein n=1 Tax=unclassified Undibacterium TaxID=2630295 RepID=UPI002B2340D2|nr:hypothetical protein [Undibacterium sp. RTI2.2]MEB0033139.1 hypothetical protein [Undibacterium sp. RTI2.1]MEB0118878.1 hypothetical protein [Undibacterium sp. RTI2.2]